MMTTTTVRIAVARFELTPSIPTLASIEVSAAKTADSNAYTSHIITSPLEIVCANSNPLSTNNSITPQMRIVKRCLRVQKNGLFRHTAICTNYQVRLRGHAFSNTRIFCAKVFMIGIHVTSLYAGLSVHIPRRILSSFTRRKPLPASPRSSKLFAPHLNFAPVA